MTPIRMIAAAIGAALVCVPMFSTAQQKVDIGKSEFDSNCAVCHGMSGKGDGPYAADVGMKGVPNLTVLAKKNHGVFPFAGVYETIDGTHVVKAHGSRDMPIWGADYKVMGNQSSLGYPYSQEAFVRARILALVEYVYRLQAK